MSAPFSKALALSLGVFFLLLPALAHGQGKEVKRVMEWSGRFRLKQSEPLMNEAPKSGYIANAKAWAKLWNAWRNTLEPSRDDLDPRNPGKKPQPQEVPTIDFDKYLVLVATAPCSANRLGMSLTLTDQGDLRVGSFATQIGGPGFVYLIVVVERAGIKTVGGQPILAD